MKKILLTITASLLLTAASAVAQFTFVFDDGNAGDLGAAGGTYTPGQTFSFTISLNAQTAVAGGISGYSLWFETASANAGLFTITSRPSTIGSIFEDENSFSDEYPDTIGDIAIGTRPGFVDNDADLGAVAGTNQPSPGVYFLSTIQFSISNSIAPGTYTIGNTTQLTGHPNGQHSVVNQDTTTFNPESSLYTITIVPEPSTWAMLVVGGIGAVAATRFRFRRNA